MTVLVPFTLAAIIWALWIRRITWCCKWEVAATLNIALQGAAVFLMSPFASDTIGKWLHYHTGIYNLEDYLAHDLYIVAASAIVYNVTGRLGNNHIFQQRFTRWVEYPATIAIPVLLAAFTQSQVATSVWAGDFLALQPDWWLAVYWLGFAVTVTLLLGYAVRGLRILRRSPNPGTANAYLLACWCGILACLVRSVTALHPTLREWENGALVWLFSLTCGAVFAVTAGKSWIQRTKIIIPDRVPA